MKRILVLLAVFIGGPALAVIAYSAVREARVDRYNSEFPAHFVKGIYVGDKPNAVTNDRRNKVTAILAGRLEYAFPAGVRDAGFTCDPALNLAYVPGALVGDVCLVTPDRGIDVSPQSGADATRAYRIECIVTDAGVVTVERCSTTTLAVGDAGYRITVISNQ